jgi:putative spermidine/putrescine transport system permease protein
MLLIAPAAMLTIAFLVLPLFYLLRFSFLDGDFVTGDLGDLTLGAYLEVLSNTYFLGVIGRTFLISLIVTVVALLAGFPLAALMWRVPTVWRSPLTILVLSPLLVSMVASSYGWIVILGNKGVINNTLASLGLISMPLKLLYTNGAIVVGLVHVVLPFMVLSLLAALDRIEPHLSEAAAVLGANQARIWWHILLPLCVPGIGAGVTLTFALSISAYVTPAILGPSGPNFITTLIYQNFINLYEWGQGSVLAFLLLLTSILIVLGFSMVISRMSPGRRSA